MQLEDSKATARGPRNARHRTAGSPIASKRKADIFVLSCTLIACAIVCLLFLAYNGEDSTVVVQPLDSYSLGDIDEVRFKVESSTEVQNNEKRIEGWFLVKGVTYDFYNYGNDQYRSEVYNNVSVAFLDNETVYVLPTKLYQRPEVTKMINDGIDYHFCGFVANIPSEYSSTCLRGQLCFVGYDPKGNAKLYIAKDSQGGGQAI